MPDCVVPANASKGVTCFSLKQGEKATVSVTGKWMTHPAPGRLPYGAGGDGIPCENCSYLRSPAGEGCLVWFVPGVGIVNWRAGGRWERDDDVKVFYVPGEYHFAANDDNYEDNTGALTVHYEISN